MLKRSEVPFPAEGQNRSLILFGPSHTQKKAPASSTSCERRDHPSVQTLSAANTRKSCARTTSVSAPLIATHLDGVEEAFSKHGIAIEHSEMDRSSICGNFLPLANARRIELLDHSRLRQQLLGLERKTSRLKEIIDHVRGAHDDLANSACLALVSAAGTLSGPAMWTAFAEKWPEAHLEMQYRGLMR